MAAVLSFRRARVDSANGVWWANTAWCAMAPRSSRSEFVMVPDGFEADTRSCCMTLGKAARQRMAGAVVSGGNQTPPVPVPEASQLPM